MSTPLPRKNVLVFRRIPDDLLARLQAQHDVTVAEARLPDEFPRFREALRTAHGLIGSSFRLGAVELAEAANLEVVSSISVGIDNYDLAYLKQRGVTLCHTPGVLTETTADTIFGLVMCTSRRFVELSNLVRDGRWTKNIGEDLFGHDVHGKTLGMLGFGRIGQAVARRGALGFGMTVKFYDPFPVPVPEALAGRAAPASLDEVLAGCDIVAATLPLSAETAGLMGPREFGLMKPGSIFVNGSRGGIVQEDALLEALDRGTTLRAAGLDVFAVEPLPLDSPLRTHPKVTPLPHAGSATHETRRAMAELAVENLLQALAGTRPACAFDLSKVAG